jgi:UDP-N-acetylmuramate dehydrogenase
MSAVAIASGTVPAELPSVRGRLIADAPVGRHTWFGVGGLAELLFLPADRGDLAIFLGALPKMIPVHVIGGGANILVRDGGIPGVTIRLGNGFAGLSATRNQVTAGAAALHLNIAQRAADAGVAGLEFLSGIPGTIGGGLRMNAGAYGQEIKEIVVSATALDRLGREHVMEGTTLGFSYRRCAVDPDWIFVEAWLRGESGDRDAITQRMTEIRGVRAATQPIRARTGGSTFKNPPGASAWRLIDAAGCRGLTRGAAMVSPRHTNFLINTGGATAADLEGLGEEVRRRVFETSGITLEWEIRRIGRPLRATEPSTEIFGSGTR